MTSQAYVFAPKLNRLNKTHRVKWGKTTKFGFLHRSGSFACSDQ